MNRLKSWLLVLALVLVSTPVMAEEDYYSRENILKFAENLYAEGDFRRAAGEYLRVAAHAPDTDHRDSLWYRVAAAYCNLKEPGIARNYLLRISKDSADTLLVCKAASLSLFSYYLEKKYDSVVGATRAMSKRLLIDETARRSNAIAAASLLKQYRWSEAVDVCGDPGLSKDDHDTLTGHLLALGRQGMALRSKNPAAAAAMSAIIPGSGKAYAHRTWDGFISLIIIGTSGWQAYEGYRKDGPASVRCIGFGALGFTFYCGNIYGSYTAARLYNQTQKRTIADRVQINYSW